MKKIVMLLEAEEKQFENSGGTVKLLLTATSLRQPPVLVIS